MFKEEELALAQTVGRLAIWELNVKTGSIRWLPGAAPLSGRPIESVTTIEQGLEGVALQDRQRFMAALQEAATTGETISIEFRLGEGEGARWVLTRGRLSSGDKQTLLMVSMDVTERHKAEDAIRTKARLLDLAFEPIIVRDEHDRITYWNAGAEKLYGYSASEANGKLSHELLHTRAEQSMGEILARFARSGEWQGELIHSTRSGRTVHVASKWQKLKDEDSERYSVLEVNFDLSEQKALQLARIWEEKAELIGQLSHEINNPLAAASGVAHLLRHERNETEMSRYVSILEESIGRIAEFIRRSNEFHSEMHEDKSRTVA